VEGDQGGPQSEPDAPRGGATVETPDVEAHQDVSKGRQGIAEQTLVDRIKRSDRWLISLTAAMAIAGSISAIIFWRQLSVMQGQLDIMTADQRPWISVEQLSIGGPLLYDDTDWPNGKRWHIKLVYTLKNHGKSPATHVIFWGHIAPIVLHYQKEGAFRGTFIKTELDKACGWPENSTEMGIDAGELMFPGDEWAPRTFEVQGDDKDFSDAKTDKSQYTGIFLIPICVTYRSAYSGIQGLSAAIVGIPSEVPTKSVFGNDRYRTAEGYRLGLLSKTSIDLDITRIEQSDLVLGKPGFQAISIQ
jgi:hypothetical protein